MRGILQITAAAAVTVLAGCTSSGATAPMSATAAVRATGPAADAALVCHHYMHQRAWVRSITRPTLSDAVQVLTDIALDVMQSEGTGKLHADLQAMYAAGKAGHDIHALSQRVYADCAAIGITS